MRPSLPDDDLSPERSLGAYPAWATIPTWCGISDMSRSAAYRALAQGHLRAVKMGSRTLIDVPHGLAWLDSLPAATLRVGGGRGQRDAHAVSALPSPR